MFLNKLSFLEKEYFLSLALCAAEANDEVTDEEYSMLEEYCKEMDVAFFDSKNAKTIEEITDFFKDSEIANKKIVLLEIIGLMYADGNYDEQEKIFVQKFANKIGIVDETVEKLDELIVDYIKFTKRVLEEIQ